MKIRFKPTIIRKSYWKFIEDEAKLAGSDGCTGVSEWHPECCKEHDLACHFGKDPRSAYTYYCAKPDCKFWELADVITRRGADYAFAICNLEWSPTPFGKIRSIIRFAGVRIGAFLGIGRRQPKDLTNAFKKGSSL